MAIDDHARGRILRAARKLRGRPYDHDRSDDTWQDITVEPATFTCSTFVCRVGMEALGHAPDFFAHEARWLLDELHVVDAPKPGDLVGYCRLPDHAERRRGHDLVWHVMIYLGNGDVIGDCDLAGEVTVRALEYEDHHGDWQWQLIMAPFLEMRPR